MLYITINGKPLEYCTEKGLTLFQRLLEFKGKISEFKDTKLNEMFTFDQEIRREN